MYGFCGSSSAHCGVGCQSGQCDGAPVSAAPGPVPARKGSGTTFTLIGQAGVPPMHAALMPNGKVVFLDKVENYSQLRLRNGQYAYSSEFNPNTGQVVPLAFKTNAFCSGGAFMADGRLVNVGGNGPLSFIDPTVSDGFSALRYLQRSASSPSFDGQDWSEPGNKLASPRWYASAHTLPDGRIFVASGSLNGLDPTVRSNNNPTYEILSPQGISSGRNVPMAILEKAQPYYMYPFIHTLKDGSLFIFVAKSAQIFNVNTNTVVRELPDLPGEFRSYPNTGTSVLLPLSSSDGYTSRVLVCGGGAYQDITSPTDASCGRIVADDPNAKWTLESMPQGRVMVEGVLLADGKVLLINGGKGAQGFDLALDPTLTPLIYDPAARQGQRFTEYPASPIPRLYHSVAVLLLDGTVLVAGSNPVEQPLLQPNAQHPYATEFRVERWIPPYLAGDNANKRPRNIKLSTKTMRSDTVYSVEFDAINTSKHVQVVLYHGGFVTHSLHMGHRMVFMDNSGFKRGGIHQNIRFRAPPKNSAHPGPWVIYVLLDYVPRRMAGYIHQQPQGYPPPNQYGEAQGYYQLHDQQPPQNYQGPSYPPHNIGPLPPKPGETFEEQFAVEKPKYNDLWAAVLWLATFLGFVAVSVLALRGYSRSGRTSGGGIYGNKADFGLTTNTVVLFAFVLAVAWSVSLLYLLAVRTFTKQIIYATAILNVVIGIGSAAYYLYRGYYSAGIVFLIFALFYAFCFWTWRSRIPFTVLILQTVIDVAKTYGHIFLVSLIGGIIALAFSAWFSVTLVGIYVRWTPNSTNQSCREGGCSDAKVYGLVAFSVFAAFWTSEVIKNVMHVTVSGVYGGWYFSAGGSNANSPPSHPTMGAFRRAMTYSFGSICLGSLIVSFIQLLRQIATIGRNDAAQSGDILQYVFFCIAGCILSIIEWAVEFLNEYAYSYIALYGKAYFPAAKATWQLIKDRGVDALIQDCLINPVLTMGAVFVGYLCTLLAYLYLEFTKPAYNSRGSYTAIILAFSFLLGLQIANVFLNPLKSGATTIFVAIAVDPQVLMANHPDLYGRMVSVYPHIQEAIHV
ncbi:hypothetical protein DRE_07193 [Drechslerella stenobrocha 248]|uniref:Galactose oxidase-like Early set domain-containing protein n=1 Tax=Drechslerella stenobrocha 248 TaxID=1043628 RepID=W7HJL8_9PEZI|nr:hypothetical protein DRE_07193 [Drechslerella stenobrocha 248]